MSKIQGAKKYLSASKPCNYYVFYTPNSHFECNVIMAHTISNINYSNVIFPVFIHMIKFSIRMPLNKYF